jgi:cytochrome c oxidase subunit 2
VPIQEGKDVRFVIADERYIRDSILMPKSEVVAGYEPVMPSYQGQMSEQDLLKILAYVKSIGTKEVGQ